MIPREGCCQPLAPTIVAERTGARKQIAAGRPNRTDLRFNLPGVLSPAGGRPDQGIRRTAPVFALVAIAAYRFNQCVKSREGAGGGF